MSLSVLAIPPWHARAAPRAPQIVTDLVALPHPERIVAGGCLIYAYDFRKLTMLTGDKLAAQIAMLDAAIAARQPIPVVELCWISRAAGLAYWNREDLIADFTDFGMRIAIAVFGMAGLDAALRRIDEDPASSADGLMQVDSPRVAPLMARLWARAKPRDGMADAERWLLKFTRAASIGLVPIAVGSPGKARDDAEHALRMLDARGHGTTIREVAGLHGDAARDAITEVLAAFAPPKKPPRLPGYMDVGALPALRVDGTLLDPTQLGTLLEMFAAWPPVSITISVPITNANLAPTTEIFTGAEGDDPIEVEEDLEVALEVNLLRPRIHPAIRAVLCAR
ncbi:MAG: hypothetical protein H0T79_20490 [Deltaproteobacteria bacterium]|nr:hypothetical protein [Deltaproteobacteria bacterium]